MTAFLEQAFGMCRLKIVDPDFRTRNVRSDGQHRYTIALTIEEPVYEMQIARAAAACAYSQLTGQVGFAARRERSALLMANMDPVDRFVPAQ